MGKSIFLAAVLMFLGSMAFAGHAISLEPEAAPAPAVEPAAAPPSPVSKPAAETPVAEPALPAVAPTLAAQPAPNVNVTFPSQHDLYLVPAATREVCTTREWGFGEIQTDCRTTPIRVRAEDPALRGLCVTRYGRRICY
jgi:hypothetical protein